MGKHNQGRQCAGCGRFFHAAMFLIRGRTICAKCAAQEIAGWNAMMRDLNKTLGAALLVFALLGLSACSESNEVNSYGVQKCTVEINGKEQPCSNPR